MSNKKYIYVKKYYRWRKGQWFPCHETEFFKAMCIADAAKHFSYHSPDKDITILEFGGYDMFYSCGQFKEVTNA